MRFKELLVPFSLALLTTWAFQYFFNARNKPQPEQQTTPQSGQHFNAPSSIPVEIHKRLNLEVNFLEKVSKKPVVTKIETPEAHYIFSTEGASLEHIEFKRKWGGKEGYLSTVFAPSVIDRERRCFLIALNEPAPFTFDLINKKEDEEHIYLEYSAIFEYGTIRKEFTIFKNNYRIDLAMLIEPAANKSLQARIFFPSPFIPELGTDDWIKGIVNEGDTIRVYDKNDATVNGYWSKPTLFGTQDRYFIHSMVTDKDNFAQRGYYKIIDLEHMYSIIEGPEITTPTSWQLSFYFGPKEQHAIKEVDERLITILNYGWLSVISRPVSKILLDILNYLYDYVHNYGLAIIILTILMKLIMMPFTFNSEQSMKKRLEFQKKLQHIQEKYKNDKETLAIARADLIRKHGMPGLGGCLPLLMQIPLFIALSWVLGNSIELYKAPFLWIQDLSAADPYYILPILVGISMLFHNPTQAIDPKQKVSMIAMALIFAAFSANFSAGLVLYILTSTLLGIAQSSIARRFA